MSRQMFANGGQVRQMQAGGSPMMPSAPEQAVDLAAVPQMGMVGMPPPEVGSMGEAEAMGAQAGVDPAVLEQMLGQVAGQFGGIDEAAENEDYEGVINAIRGDQAPLQERRVELAGVVGEEDAQSTPDSVLTLVQPVMQMAAMDEGIGSLAPEVMDTPVQGDMAGGIMSTVNMGAEEAPVPVNFSQGGAVQYFAPENENRVAGAPDPRALELFQQDKALYNQLIGVGDQQAAYDEQKKMTQAQMLFDIAQAALAFATPGDRQMSPAERLAEVAQPVLGNIGARSGELLKFKQGQDAERRQLDMAALQSSQTKLGAEKLAASSLKLAKAKSKPGDAKYQRLIGPNGENLGTFNIGTTLGTNALDEAISNNPNATLYNIGTEPADSSTSDLKIVVSPGGQEQTFDLNTEKGRQGFESASSQEGAKVYNVGSAPSDQGYKTITIYDPKNPTVPITRPINTPQQRQAVSELLNKGFTSDDTFAAASIAEQFQIREEGRDLKRDIQQEARALKTTLAAEKRLLDKTLKEEERAVFVLIAKEGRAEEAAIRAERRANDTTLSTEERAEARKLAEEKRAELAQIRKDGRDLKTQIEEEKRNLRTTLDKEKREEDSPFTQLINDVLYRIDPSMPEGERKTILIDGSTLPDTFGSGTTGKIMSLVSNEDFLAKYASNTLSKEVDGITSTDMEAALIAYTSPTSTAYSADAKSVVSTPGKSLTATMIDALQTRKLQGLSVPTGVYFPQDSIDAAVDERLGLVNGLDDPPPMTEFLGDAAWGSKAWVQNLSNNLLEFAQAPAYFIEAKDAIEAVKNLNQEFETVFLASQEIRDSVYQGKKLEDLTPKPAKFWGTGPDAARSKALNLYERLKRHIQITEAQLNDPSIPMPQTGPGSLQKKQERLQTLKDLKAGYGVLAGLDLLSRGMDPADKDRSEAEEALIQELNKRISTPTGGD